MSMSVFTLALLALCWLSPVAGESLAGESSPRQVWAGDTAGYPSGAEPAPAPAEAPHPLKNIVKRRTETSAPPCPPVSFTLPFGDPRVWHPCAFFRTDTSPPVPLYQLLRVYRF